MRLRALGLVSFAAPSLIGCSDPAPQYPPIVINVIGTGNVGPGLNTSGSSAGPQGGSSSNSSGGSSNSAGGSSGQANGPSGLFAHCSAFAGAADPPTQTACDLATLENGGELSGTLSADRTLESGYYYTLKGGVKVAPGVTLTIQPCVKVIGENPDAVLVIQSSALGDPKRSCTYDGGSITVPAGKLVAVGEPMAPIIFTSAKAPGTRAPGDWGGLLILGNARNDLAGPGLRVPIEGLAQAECHGYHTDEFNEESSGHLEYVRIEFASRQVSEANETNGLTLGSVGSGTEVHHVMVSNSADDCFEWFGGTMNAHHLIALNCDDDMFDMDNGFSGHLQFLFGRQYPTTTEADSRGMEIDTGNGLKTVPTLAAISNYTLCGGGPDDQAVSRAGLVFRTQAQPTLMNGFVTGFAGPGYLNEGATPTVTYTRIFGQNVVANDSNRPAFLAGMGNSPEEPDRFCDCWANPAAPVAAAPIAGGTPTGFADASAAYLGAFESAEPASNWMKGSWVDWSSN